MQTLTGTQQKVLTRRTHLGTIPKSQFVESRAFVPAAAGIDTTDKVDVFAESPVMDPKGQPLVQTEKVEIQAKAHSPVKDGLIAAALATGISAVLSGFRPEAMVASAVAAGASAALIASGDEVSLVQEKQTVNKPVLEGYNTYATDSAFLPGRSKNWLQDSGGTQFTFVEKIGQKPVGEISVAKVKHSTPEGLRWLGPQAPRCQTCRRPDSLGAPEQLSAAPGGPKGLEGYPCGQL